MQSNEELKFLLNLLGFPNYRVTLTHTRFKYFKSKKQLCQTLAERGWIDYTKEIASVRILPPGKALLNLEPNQLPVSAVDLKVLEKISEEPGKIKVTHLKMLKVTQRQPILQGLSDRGLIEIEQMPAQKKAEVWLTPQGLTYLREDYKPKGNKPVVSLDLLNNYLQFLRQSSLKSNQPELVGNPTIIDADILQAIKLLDKELGTENYLPIFELRHHLSISRELLDQALYRLQRNDQIELGSLQEVSAYTADQIDAGIPQNVGGPIFFITVTEI